MKIQWLQSKKRPNGSGQKPLTPLRFDPEFARALDQLTKEIEQDHPIRGKANVLQSLALAASPRLRRLWRQYQQQLRDGTPRQK